MRLFFVLLFSLSTGYLFAQSDNFWSSYPSTSQARQITSSQPVDGCEWREQEITITIFGNDEVWLNADVITMTCDSDGKSQNHGGYVRIENHGKSSFFYRSSPPDTYENPNAKTFQRGTSSNAYYVELRPGESRVVGVIDYSNQKDKYLPTHAVLNVKYCKPNNYPTKAGIESLQRFKASQKRYDVNNSSEVVSRSTAVINCSRYYLAVVVASYYHQDNTPTQRVPGYLNVITSTIVKSSENLATQDEKDYNGDVMHHVKHIALPQCPDSGFDPFTTQNLIRNINVPKVLQRADIECSGSGGGPYSFAALHLFKGNTKEELEIVKQRFSDLRSYQGYFRQSYTGFNGYKSYSDNSIFTFNEKVICQEN